MAQMSTLRRWVFWFWWGAAVLAVAVIVGVTAAVILRTDLRTAANAAGIVGLAGSAVGFVARGVHRRRTAAADAFP